MTRNRPDPYVYAGPQPRRPNTSGFGRPEPAAIRKATAEYAHYLIPRDNTFRASEAQVAALASALLRAGYVAQPGSAALQRLDFTKTAWSSAAAATGAALMTKQTSFAACPVLDAAPALRALAGADFRIVWPVHTVWTAGLKYPLDRQPKLLRGQSGPSLNLEIHSLNDYVYLTSETLQPFPNADAASLPVACKVSATNLHYTADRPDNIFDLMGSRIKHTCPTCGTIFRPQERKVVVRDGWTGRKRDEPGGAAYRFAILIDCGNAIPDQGPPTAVPEFLRLCEAAIGQKLYQIGNAY
jgi:hypothetical protein